MEIAVMLTLMLTRTATNAAAAKETGLQNSDKLQCVFGDER